MFWIHISKLLRIYFLIRHIISEKLSLNSSKMIYHIERVAIKSIRYLRVLHLAALVWLIGVVHYSGVPFV